ncbi:MAG: YdcF family protein [Anaerolineales bacterium]|nr:YdcF family protein [Anaerolineales bacterium]
MDGIVLFTKSYFLPGSMAFLLLGLLIGVVLLLAGDRRRPWGTRWLVALLAGYWLMATPAFSSGAEGLLGRGFSPIATKAEASGARAVVVLSGGTASFEGAAGRVESLSEATALRLLEGARLYKMLDQPWVVLSGGPPGDDGLATPEAVAMERELVRLGVPEERILVEMTSADTHAQAQQIKPLLNSRGVEEFVLVTSGWHLRRSLGAFAREGMHPIPSAAFGRSIGEEAAGLTFLPSESSLARSRDMAREVLALVYYRLRGWI